MIFLAELAFKSDRLLGPFHTSWLEGIDIREDSVRIYDTSKEIIIDVNQQ